MSEATGGGSAPSGGGDTGAQAGGEAVAPQQAQTPRMLKLMMDGKEVEYPESEVVGNFKKGRESAKLLTLAQQRREEALREKAATEGLVAKLKKGGAEGRAALRALGVDPAKMGEEEILEMIRMEKMSPAEKERYELQQKIKGFEDEKKKAEDEKKTAAHEAEKQRHMDELGGLFAEALTKTGLPRAAAPALFPRMAALYAQNEEAGLESTPEEMAHHVMEGVRETQKAMYGRLKGQELLDFIGPEVLKEILNANLQRNSMGRVPGVPQQSRQPRPVAKPAGAKDNPRTGADYLRRLSEGILD